MATVYVPGPSLAEAVEDNGPLPVKDRTALAAGLAEALAGHPPGGPGPPGPQAVERAARGRRPPGDRLRHLPGARAVHDDGDRHGAGLARVHVAGAGQGTAGVGAPTDMFSLGAVLAFAATGSSPFGVGPTPALLYRVVNEVAGPPGGARPAQPADRAAAWPRIPPTGPRLPKSSRCSVTTWRCSPGSGCRRRSRRR